MPFIVKRPARPSTAAHGRPLISETALLSSRSAMGPATTSTTFLAAAMAGACDLPKQACWMVSFAALLAIVCALSPAEDERVLSVMARCTVALTVARTSSVTASSAVAIAASD